MEKFKKLTRTELKNINGGMKWKWCSRKHSGNVIDLRPNAPEPAIEWQNSYGCWISGDMSPFSHPDRPGNNGWY